MAILADSGIPERQDHLHFRDPPAKMAIYPEAPDGENSFTLPSKNPEDPILRGIKDRRFVEKALAEKQPAYF